MENRVLVVEAESESETEALKEWRTCWHAEPKKEIWFKCYYYDPVQTVVI